MQVATLSTYWTYLERTTFLSLELAAVLALAAAVVAVAVLVLRLGTVSVLRGDDPPRPPRRFPSLASGSPGTA